MAINAKMGVDIGSFKSGIQEGQNILKGLNAEMKATEAEFKATGNAEKALEQKTKTLNSQLQVQKGIADQARAALEAMDKAGIEPTDKAYQQMYATMMNATAGMNEAQAALNGLGTSAAEAAGQADQLTQSVNGISKKISLDQVLSGINAITTGLETAAKKAVQLGQDIWNAAMDAARMSDDILTQASMLDMTPEQYQKYKGVFDTIGEISIQEWAAAKRKVQAAINNPSQDQMDVLGLLGVNTHDMVAGKSGTVEGLAKDWETVFWEAAQSLQDKVNNGVISQDLADTYGEMLFGKKFSSLKNLIKLGEEGFKEALGQQATVDDEALKKNAELNDAVIKLQDSFDALKQEVMSAMAPALTNLATSLDSVLSTILEYLKSPDGQEMLKSLGDTISSLFEDLTNVDPNSVLETLTSAFDSIKQGLEWIKTNKESLITALEAIGVAFGALKLGEMAINVWKFVDGARTLLNMGGGTDAVVTDAGTGATVGDMTLLSKAGALGLTGVMMMAPAIISGIVRSVLPEDMQIDREAYVKAGTYSEDDIKKAREYASTQNEINELLEKSYSIGLEDQEQKRLEELSATHDALKDIVDSDLWDRYTKYLDANETQKGGIFDLSILDKMLAEIEGEGGVPVKVDPQAEDNAAADLAEQIGTVSVPVRLEYAGGAGVNMPENNFANGIPYVPYDGLLARLHKGERVVTAREMAASRNYSSNLYVESMYMNNGVDAQGLAAAMAAAQRRTMSGYGS